MLQIGWIDSFSIFIMFLFFFLFILSVLGLGYNLATRLIKPEQQSGYGAMSGGIASLLAFMLALTFSMAATRNDGRKVLVVEQANVIGTAYLRADLLPNDEVLESKSLIKQHLDLSNFPKLTTSEINHRLNLLSEVEAKLWVQVIRINKKADSIGVKLYTESINDLFDTVTKRTNTAMKGRIPATIWLALLALTFLGVMLVGLQSGNKNKVHVFVASIPFALALSIVLTLVVELDRPTRSIIGIQQGALIDLQQKL